MHLPLPQHSAGPRQVRHRHATCHQASILVAATMGSTAKLEPERKATVVLFLIVKSANAVPLLPQSLPAPASKGLEQPQRAAKPRCRLLWRSCAAC